MAVSRLENIKSKLDELIKLDSAKTIFGASAHQYAYDQTIPETVLQDFEKNAGVRLPGGYRVWLNTISNGGAGPYYGLYAFDKAVEDCMEYYFTENEQDTIDWEQITPEKEKNNLKKYFAPFPITTKQVEEIIQINESYEDDVHKTIVLPERITGIVLLCDYGCGGHYFLVVNGEQAGTVWFLQEHEYLNPCYAKGTQWNFYDFMDWWIHDSILTLTDPKERYQNDVSDPLKKKELIYDQQGLKEIPEEVYTCKNLRKFMFSRDDLKEIPVKLFALSELRVLNLYMNTFERIPDEIEQLQKLTVLDISYCAHLIYIPPAIGKLKNLKKLKLTYCANLLQLPGEIGLLSNLKELCLSYTGLTDLPERVKDLSNLSLLQVYTETMDLEKLFSKIAACPNLNSLVIRENRELPVNVGLVKNIKTLFIQSNYGEETYHISLPEELTTTNIEKLYIAETKYLLPQNMGDFHSLRELHINAEQIHTLPPSVRYLKNLKLIQCDSLNNEVEITKREEIERQLPGVVFRWW
ncbi:MAG: leucine-rich repeat domain-containing protein [Chitinophagales bacterium]|nr:leucine-rich repeat domain-containing protein [Chitinophagales bacterium]